VKDAGLSYPTVHGIYHNDTMRVDLATLDALARALGCDPGNLVGKAKRRKV
jgi:DNA-binding Xre family transcriptional regulator